MAGDATRQLLEIADEVRAIASTGLHFTEGPFDRERYERLMKLAARLGALASDHAPEELERVYASLDRGYVTPKVDVRMAVFRAGRVLLVQERADGRWALPGGYADIGDSPSEAAVRETAEEAGLDVRPTRLVGIYDTRLYPEAPPHPFHIFKLVFAGELCDPASEPAAGHEVRDAAFHRVEALPELSPGRTLRLHIDHALRRADTAPHFD